MLPLPSKYLPRKPLIKLYTLYVRPYLDYVDIIYHIPYKICDYSQHVLLNNRMEKLESIQYLAFPAIEGWGGTSHKKLYDELELESLKSRQLTRRLILFYKIFSTLTSDYTRVPTPSQKCLVLFASAL